MAKLCLRIIDGAKAGRQLTLDPNESCTIGRSPKADWPFPEDGHMSSLHCELHNRTDGVEIIDLQSSNKTWLNDQPVATAKLKDGDVFRAGRTNFAVTLLVEAEVIDSVSEPATPMKNASTAGGVASPLSSPVTIPAAVARPSHPPATVPGSPANVHSRLKRMVKPNPYDAAKNLDVIIDQLQRKKALRFIVHFQKLGLCTPEGLKEARPVYPNLPGALSHHPIVIDHGNWMTPAARGLSKRLIMHDALLVLVSSMPEALDARIAAITAQSAPGYGRPTGYFGWCWPSAFLNLIEHLGIAAWSEKLGADVEGALLFAPHDTATLIAYADESLVQQLQKMGFKFPDDSVEG